MEHDFLQFLATEERRMISQEDHNGFLVHACHKRGSTVPEITERPGVIGEGKEHLYQRGHRAWATFIRCSFLWPEQGSDRNGACVQRQLCPTKGDFVDSAGGQKGGGWQGLGRLFLVICTCVGTR